MDPLFMDRDPRLPTPLTEEVLVASRPATVEVFKEGGKRREKTLGLIPPSFSICIPKRGIGLPCCGRTCLGAGGDRLYGMEETGVWSPG